MTTILSCLAPEFAVQVGDRLVSRNGVPYDHQANKIIVYVAKDAIVSVGYSGLAYLRAAPTHQWIARHLWGEPFVVSPEGIIAMTFGRMPAPTLLAEALDTLVAEIQAIPDGEMHHPVAIQGVGLRFFADKERGIPVWFDIIRRRGYPLIHRRFIEPGDASGFQTFDVSLNAHTRPDLLKKVNTVIRSIRNRTDVDRQAIVEKLLVETAGALSDGRPTTIGPNLTMVSIRDKIKDTVRIQFLPRKSATTALRLPTTAFDISAISPESISFSPWVVTPQHCVPPAMLSGGRLTVPLAGGAELHIDGHRRTEEGSESFIQFGFLRPSA